MTVISTKSIMFFAALVVSVAMLSTVIDFNWPREVVTTEDPTPTPRQSNETPLHTSPVFLPGTQPRDLKSPPTSAEACQACHGGYADYSPYDTWRGSMMSFAAVDPLFLALNAISNRDLEGVAEVGDFCLRCHTPAAWLEGRSEPVDGSALKEKDFKYGVTCDLCMRMVDPLTEEGKALSRPDTMVYANGQYVLEDDYVRRGPYSNPQSPHKSQYSEFHTKSEFCGTCHDIYNPVYNLETPVETTYSEWLYSAYSEEGVECQDCHMPAVEGYAAYAGNLELRDNIYRHEFAGSSVWMPDVLVWMYELEPGEVEALMKTKERARETMRSAADLEARREGDMLVVRVTNLAGHKLPTGYPEGRRMWLNIRFYDDAGRVIKESGRYDPVSAELVKDDEIKVYEAKPGLKDVDGFSEGPSFHFAMNNWIYKDNRIPPRGFSNRAYEERMAYIRGATYEDGQYWDTTVYAIPVGAVRVKVFLWHQSVSKEFIEFLRDENIGNNWDIFDAGEKMYAAWEALDRSPPVEMAGVEVPL